MSQNERQRSINDLCAGILDNLTGIECRETAMNLLESFVGKNAGDDIRSASDN